MNLTRTETHPMPDPRNSKNLETVTGTKSNLEGAAVAVSDRLFPALQYPSLPSAGKADSDEIQRRLRKVRPSHAPMTISSVHLFEVASNADAKTITLGRAGR